MTKAVKDMKDVEQLERMYNGVVTLAPFQRPNMELLWDLTIPHQLVYQQSQKLRFTCIGIQQSS